MKHLKSIMIFRADIYNIFKSTMYALWKALRYLLSARPFKKNLISMDKHTMKF